MTTQTPPDALPSRSFTKSATHRRCIGSVSALALATLIGTSVLPASAQEVSLEHGDTVVTRFSGVANDNGAAAAPDPQGVVAAVLSLARPGFRPDGRHWTDEPQKLQITADQVGQVFGIAYDDREPANIYLTATSLFGLYRSEDGSGWAPGMWGPEGGPGTIYRLSAENGYQPEVFANIQLDGRENTGAGLGNIAYDKTNKQFFVTDLETGMIHRISAEDGTELSRLDHGSQARQGFYDGPSDAWQVVDPVEFDPASEARLDDCEDKGEAATGAQAPACWNLADFRRRVVAIGVRTDADTGETRVYYSTWGSQAYGNPEWAEAGEDQKNAIWSVGLTEDGEFDPETFRREFFTPALIVDAEGGEAGGENSPVFDIAFSEDGAMLLAERGHLVTPTEENPVAYTAAKQARALLYRQNEDKSAWAPEGRFDVGFDDRKNDGVPHMRINATGGADFASGYDEDGGMSPEYRDASVVLSGDNLCSENGACTDPGTGERSDTAQADGVQVTPAFVLAEISPAAAYEPYPAAGEPTAPEGPLQSLMVDPGPEGGAQANVPGGTGDVETFRGTGTPIADGGFVPEPGGGFVPEPDDGGGFVPPPPLHQKWKSNFHQKWASVQHNKFTSKPFPVHVKWKSQFHKKWKSVQHNKLTSKPFPLHIKWKSQFHKKWKSVQHNKLTSKPFPLHIKWKSQFHKKWKSVQHNKLTSKPFPLHIKWKSQFHKKWKSVQHNKLTSKPFPLHIKWKSQFHKKWKSVQHNKATSKPFPLHIKWKSQFHKKWKSVQHNKATSKPFPLHIKWKSQFHKKWKSVQHNKATSKPFPLHIKWKSQFHKKWKSVQHNKATSKPFPLHIKWKSQFHKKYKSRQHNKATSRPFQVKPLHLKWKSQFHKKYKSRQHNKATTRLIRIKPQHLKWKSQFHRKYKSRQHNKATTRLIRIQKQPVHSKARSRVHNKATSRPIRLQKRPVHSKTRSNLRNQQIKRPQIKRPNRKQLHNKFRSLRQNNSTRPLNLRLQ